MQKRGVVVDHLFNVVGCRRCGHVYINPRLDDGAIEALYDDEYYEGRGFDRTVRYADPIGDDALLEHYDNEVRTLREAAGSLQGCTALDIGCGAGGLVRAMRLAGADAAGFDTSASSLRLCESNGTPLAARSLDELYAQGKTYDLVSAMEVIEHTLSPTEFLTRVKTLVKPGGVLLIGTGNWNLVRRIPGTPYIMPEGHIQYFTPVTLRAFFRKAGLETTGSFNYLWIGWRVLKKRIGPSAAPFTRFAGAITSRVAPGYGPFPVGRKS